MLRKRSILQGQKKKKKIYPTKACKYPLHVCIGKVLSFS